MPGPFYRLAIYVDDIMKVSNKKFFDKAFCKDIVIGIITGLVTGLVVGGILFYYQSWINKNEYIQSNDHDVSIFLEEIKNTIIDLNTFSLQDLKTAPIAITTFADLANKNPFTTWKDKTNQNKPFVALIIDFQKSYFDFIKNVHNLDTEVRRIIRMQNSSRKLDQINDVVNYQYFIGKLYGLSDQDILPYLEFGQDKIYPRIKETQNILLLDPKIELLSKKYIELKNVLELKIKSFISKLFE